MLASGEGDARSDLVAGPKRASLYISYFGIAEPLVETQVVAYLAELSRRSVEVHLLTFDAQRFEPAEAHAISARLASRGIRWHSLRYHRRPSLPATAYDVLVGAWKAMQICRRHGIGLVHARSHVPAAMASILKRTLGCRVLFDLRGLLAEEYADFGHWSRGGLKFALTRRMEKRFYREADALVVLTHRIKRELLETEEALRGREADITVIPCCVDVERFRVSPEDRMRVRRERGWSDRTVLTYVGRIGSWYLHQHMAAFVATACRQDPGIFFSVLTQSDPAPIESELRGAGVPPSCYWVGRAFADELPALLGASDAGLCFLEGASKRASSPTKIGEYMAAGLPVITNPWGGDYVEVLRDQRLGVVLDEFSEPAFSAALRELRELLGEPDLTARVRSFADEELSLSAVGGARYASVYERLLAPGDRVSSASHPAIPSRIADSRGRI